MPSKKLTDRMVFGLKPPPSGQVEISDSVIAGFGVRIGTTGRPTFIYRYRKAGRRWRVTIGRYGEMSLADARLRARQLIGKLAAGEDPACERVLPHTVGEFIDVFLQRHVSSLRPATQIQYRSALERDVRPLWGDLQLVEIKRRHVVELLDRIVDRGAAVTANRVQSILHRLFEDALERELIEVNPAAGVRRRTREQERDRVLTDSEIRLLWQVLEREAEPLRSLVRVLILCGQRSGETRRMRWKDLDLKTGTWSIPSRERKNAKPHVVPLAHQAVAILKGLASTSEWVFPSPGTRSTADEPFQWLSHATARLRKACDFSFTMHDLRRTCASGMRRLGTDRATVRQILGHADPSILKVYDRYAAEPEKRQALEKWAKHIEKILAENEAVPINGRKVEVRTPEPH